MRYALFAAVRFNRDAARHVATKTIHAAFMVVPGGGIFAKTAKTPPLQSALRGILPQAIVYARAGINGNGEWEDNDAACRVVFIGLQKKITCRSIFEIGYCILGRGDAVGAGRELPAHPRVLALTTAANPPPRPPYGFNLLLAAFPLLLGKSVSIM